MASKPIPTCMKHYAGSDALDNHQAPSRSKLCLRLGEKTAWAPSRAFLPMRRALGQALCSATSRRVLSRSSWRRMSDYTTSDTTQGHTTPHHQSQARSIREDPGTADGRRDWEDGEVNPNFAQPVVAPRLLTTDGRFHKHEWKLPVSKVQPVLEVRRNAASRLVVRSGSLPGGKGLTAEDGVNLEVVSMFFGWLGNTYKAFNDRAKEADYSLAILRDVIDDVRELMGRPRLEPRQFGSIIDEITKRCLVITRELGIRDYIFAMRDDTTLPWLQVQRDIFIMINGEYPVNDRPEYTLERQGHTPAQITYLFRDGELVGNASIPYEFSEDVWETFIRGKYVATVHAEIDAMEKVTALFIDLADVRVGVRVEFSDMRDAETAPMGGISRKKSLPLSLFECIITGFADCLIETVTDDELVRVAERVRAELTKISTFGTPSSEEFHILKALNHLTALNWHLKALMIAEFRNRLMRFEQASDGFSMELKADIRPAKVAGQTPNGLGIHGKREKDTLGVIFGSLAYMAGTAVATFQDDIVSEGMKVLPTGFGVAAALATYYHTVVHRRSFKDFIIGVKEHATFSDAIRYNRKEDILAGLLAKNDIEKMVDTHNACYLGHGGTGIFKADVTVRASELVAAGAEFGVSGLGELCYRRGSGSQFQWFVAIGDGDLLHVTAEVRTHVMKIDKLAADAVVAG